MCLIAFAISAHADFPLVIAANRDEQWHRPTLALQAWSLPSGKTLYSGRDQEAGGTWLGFSEDGRVALLTNVRSGSLAPGERSRGELVTQWLDDHRDWRTWLADRDATPYGGFNLITGDTARGEWSWMTNRPLDRSTPRLQGGWHGHALRPGVYGLSNAGLDTPWPKTVALKTALQSHIQALVSISDTTHLLPALLDMTLYPDAQLPHTGVGLAAERELSSAFVHAPQRAYGTRSSLLAHWASTGNLTLDEWTHAPERCPLTGARPAQWPLENSTQRRISISTWGMPASS